MRPSRINCINSYYFLYLLNVLLPAMLNAFNYGKWECFKIPHSGVKCFEKSLGDISLPLITSPKLCLSGSLQWKQSLHIAMKNSAVIWLIAVKWRIALQLGRERNRRRRRRKQGFKGENYFFFPPGRHFFKTTRRKYFIFCVPLSPGFTKRRCSVVKLENQSYDYLKKVLLVRISSQHVKHLFVVSHATFSLL